MKLGTPHVCLFIASNRVSDTHPQVVRWSSSAVTKDQTAPEFVGLVDQDGNYQLALAIITVVWRFPTFAWPTLVFTIVRPMVTQQPSRELVLA